MDRPRARQRVAKRTLPNDFERLSVGRSLIDSLPSAGPAAAQLRLKSARLNKCGTCLACEFHPLVGEFDPVALRVNIPGATPHRAAQNSPRSRRRDQKPHHKTPPAVPTPTRPPSPHHTAQLHPPRPQPPRCADPAASPRLHLRGNTPRPQKSHGLARSQPSTPLALLLGGGDPGAGRKRLAPTVNLWVAAGSGRSAASICRRSCCTMKSFGPCLASCLAS